ncbi:MAG: hypothetical protein RSF83_01565 [Hungatella sp.]
MKIDLQSTLNYYTPSIDPKRPVSSSATPHKAAGNFDAITSPMRAFHRKINFPKHWPAGFLWRFESPPQPAG